MKRAIKYYFSALIICFCHFALLAQKNISYPELINNANESYTSGKFTEAAQLFEQASTIESGKDKSDNLYNAACSWALAGNKEKAFDDLNKVAEYGFVDFNFIGKDRDLLSLHSEPGWQTLNEKLHSQFNKGNSSFLWGIYFGIMFILFFYNLFLFFSLKEISFFYFSVFLFMYASMEILRTPEFNFYLSDVLFWMKYLKPVNSDSFNVCLLTIIYLPFVRSFLSLKKKAQRLDKWMKGLIIGFIAGTVLAYFSDFLKTSIAYPAFILAYSFSVVTGIYLWKIKYQAARFFVVGSFFLLLGLLWNVLFYSQLIHFSGNILVFHPDNIAIIIFLFMSSFALGDKINILKSEKMLAQEKALEILEEKVTERTAEVVKQKEIIEEKNKDITDSINYSKRIQQAKLPKKEEITAALPQNFVLFKPKDIVSGDFYFFHKNNQSVFIAAADCTGHGVPGALMSMIGSEKLDDALSQTTNTSEILSHLNKGIKTSLRQSDSDESTRDGMDIAICSVDTTNCIVNYAGANRPIWIIRKSQQAIEEIKATKKAIGGLTEDNQHFETHEIKLQHGDTFYIFSDGYADTFNGEQGKKLTTKKFKEILLSIQEKTMQLQELHLDNFIENWKAGGEQVDDILVIGVRL